MVFLKLLKYVLCVLVSILITFCAAAQTGSIKGKVTSQGKVIPYVTIGIPPLGLGSTSDTSGYFEIKNIPFGKYQLEARIIGYSTFKGQVYITATQPQTVNIQLTKKFTNGFELYGGIKNVLNFVPKDPIMRPFDPFDKYAGDASSNPNGYTFDPSYNYASLQGIRFFLGIRYAVFH